MKGDHMGTLAAHPSARELAFSNQTRFRCSIWAEWVRHTAGAAKVAPAPRRTERRDKLSITSRSLVTSISLLYPGLGPALRAYRALYAFEPTARHGAVDGTKVSLCSGRPATTAYGRGVVLARRSPW